MSDDFSDFNENYLDEILQDDTPKNWSDKEEVKDFGG